MIYAPSLSYPQYHWSDCDAAHRKICACDYVEAVNGPTSCDSIMQKSLKPGTTFADNHKCKLGISMNFTYDLSEN